MDILLLKTVCTQDLIGTTVFIPLSVGEGKLSKIPNGTRFNANVQKIPEKKERSRKQLDLYWVGCRFIADQTENRQFNTQKKVDSQCKLSCRLIEDELRYRIKATGEIRVHLILGSVSYAKLRHLDACGYFSEAFDYQTEIYNIIQKRNNPNHQSIIKDEYTELLKQFIANDYNLANGLD